MPEPVDLFVWRNAIASKHGPRLATTRHILLTLSLPMHADGTGAYPSQKTLAERCLVTRRTVITHLELAERDGWLVREPGPKGGKGWRLTSYSAVVPEHVYDQLPQRPWEADHEWQRGERPSPAQAVAKRREDHRGETDTAKVVNGTRDRGEPDAYRGEPDATVILPLNSSSVILPKREGALARTPPSEKTTSKKSSKKKTKTTKTTNGLVSIADLLPDQTTASQEVRHERPAPLPATPQGPLPISDYKRSNILEMARMGNYSTETIAKLSGLAPEKVREIIAEAAA